MELDIRTNRNYFLNHTKFKDHTEWKGRFRQRINSTTLMGDDQFRNVECGWFVASRPMVLGTDAYKNWDGYKPSIPDPLALRKTVDSVVRETARKVDEGLTTDSRTYSLKDIPVRRIDDTISKQVADFYELPTREDAGTCSVRMTAYVGDYFPKYVAEDFFRRQLEIFGSEHISGRQRDVPYVGIGKIQEMPASQEPATPRHVDRQRYQAVLPI